MSRSERSFGRLPRGALQDRGTEKRETSNGMSGRPGSRPIARLDAGDGASSAVSADERAKAWAADQTVWRDHVPTLHDEVAVDHLLADVALKSLEASARSW